MPKISYKKLCIILIFVFMFGSGCTILSLLQGQSSSTSEQEAFEETSTAIQRANETAIQQIYASETAVRINATATAEAEQGE